MTDIKSMTKDELKNLITELGEKPFRAKQIYSWLHEHLVTSYDEMGNIPGKLKEKLKDYPIAALEMVDEQVSAIDGTRKYLFRENGLTIDDYFDKLYFSYEIGASKPDAEFYKRVIDDTKVNPAESLFLDDKTENIDGARQAGFQVCQVCPEDNLREKLFPFLNGISI